MDIHIVLMYFSHLVGLRRKMYAYSLARLTRCLRFVLSDPARQVSLQAQAEY